MSKVQLYSPNPDRDRGRSRQTKGDRMSMMLTIAATILFLALWPILANVWDVSRFGYIAARWAIALWVLSIDAALFAAALWTGGYVP